MSLYRRNARSAVLNKEYVHRRRWDGKFYEGVREISGMFLKELAIMVQNRERTSCTHVS